MAYYPYLIALALIEQDGQRAMPIGGKSIKSSTNLLNGPGSDAEKIILEILLRVFQRTEKGCIARNAGDRSLLLIEMSMENMHQKLASIKAEWIESGDMMKLLSELKQYSKNIWSIYFIKHKGIIFNPID